MAQVSSASTFFWGGGHKNFGRLNKKLFFCNMAKSGKVPHLPKMSPMKFRNKRFAGFFFIGVCPKPEKRKKIVLS